MSSAIVTAKIEIFVLFRAFWYKIVEYSSRFQGGKMVTKLGLFRLISGLLIIHLVEAVGSDKRSESVAAAKPSESTSTPQPSMQ